MSFCVEARATFCNLEPVLVQLIHVSLHPCVFFIFCVCDIHRNASSVFICHFQTVNQLAMETSTVMRGSHSRKTAAFVRVSQPRTASDSCRPPYATTGGGFRCCTQIRVSQSRIVSLSYRRVLPTASSPSRLSAASSVVSASTCCLVR